MTKKQIEKFINLYKETDKLHKEITNLFGFDGTLCDRMFKPITELVKEFDPDEWIYWYVFDTDCGKKLNDVKINGVEKKIKSVDDLMWCMGENK